jgi:glycine cleavage system aminomethyltransferase T
LFELHWTTEAEEKYRLLKNNPALSKRYKAAKKTIQYLASNPRHNSLQTHEFTSLKGPNGEKIFEAYAQQKTPAAFRVFWYYGPSPNIITIVTIIPHP